MKGILMKPWKVKAISESSPDFVWQTRQLSGLKEINQSPESWHIKTYPDGSWLFESDAGDLVDVKPRYQVGDIVYIKEAHYAFGHWERFSEDGKFFWRFFRDCKTPIRFVGEAACLETARTIPSNVSDWYKRSPLFLPAEDACYFIKIKGVRYERLQSITEGDAIAEGCWVGKANSLPWYRSLWDSLNPQHPWSLDEWVEVDSFVKWELPA